MNWIDIMSIEKVYYELSKGLDDEYYVELASKNVMLVPVLIDFITSEHSFTQKSESLLEKISEKYPLVIYPYFNYIADIIISNNDLSSFCAWKIIANILEVDSLNLWDNIKENYFTALNSENITEFSISCDCAPKIISAKPLDKEEIVKILADTQNRSFSAGGQVSEVCRKIAMEKADSALQQIE